MHILHGNSIFLKKIKIKINHSSSNRVFSRDLLIPYRNWELKTENARAKQKCSAFGTE